MNLEAIENRLITVAQLIGSIAEANNQHTNRLAKGIKLLGTPVEELTVKELIGLDAAYKASFQQDNEENPASISLGDLENQQALQRGFEYLALEPELLLKRVKDGGHSGEFLAHAFISSYRTSTPFQHSLGEIMKLDTEAIRLFHQLIHLRFIKGWSDDAFYELEQKIIKINEAAS